MNTRGRDVVVRAGGDSCRVTAAPCPPTSVPAVHGRRPPKARRLGGTSGHPTGGRGTRRAFVGMSPASRVLLVEPPSEAFGILNADGLRPLHGSSVHQGIGATHAGEAALIDAPTGCRWRWSVPHRDVATDDSIAKRKRALVGQVFLRCCGHGALQCAGSHSDRRALANQRKRQFFEGAGSVTTVWSRTAWCGREGQPTHTRPSPPSWRARLVRGVHPSVPGDGSRAARDAYGLRWALGTHTRRVRGLDVVRTPAGTRTVAIPPGRGRNRCRLRPGLKE